MYQGFVFTLLAFSIFPGRVGAQNRDCCKPQNESNEESPNITVDLKYIDDSTSFTTCVTELDKKNQVLYLYFSKLGYNPSSKPAVYVYNLKLGTLKKLNFVDKDERDVKITGIRSGKDITAFLAESDDIIFFSNDGGESTWMFRFSHRISRIIFHPTLPNFMAVRLNNREIYISQDNGHNWLKFSDSVQNFIWFYQSPNFYMTKYGEDSYDITSLIKGSLSTSSAFETIIEKCILVTRKGGLFFAREYYQDINFMPLTNIYISLNDGPLNKAIYPSKQDFNLIDVYSDVLNEIYIDNYLYTQQILFSGSYEDMRLSRLKVQDRFENEFKACHNLELFQHIPGMIYSRIYMHKFSYKSKISKNSGRTWEDIDYNPRKCPKECINEECVLVISDHCKFPTKSRFLTHETAPNLLLAYGFLKIGKDRVEGLFISEDFGSSWYTGKRLLKHFTMLDQGGIIVGIENDGTICYSLDNGLEWIKTNIGEDLANIDIFSFEQNSLKQVLIVAQSKKNNSWILIVLDLSNIFDRECNIDDYLIIPHQTGSRRCFNGLTKTAFKRKVKSVCFNTMDHLLHRPNESRCMCTEDDLKCNFGFSMVDGDCEPDPDYFKIQTKCKYGDYVPSFIKKSFRSNNLCRGKSKLTQDHVQDLCYFTESDTVFTFMNQSGIFYKSLNIAGYGKLIDLYSTISQVISYDINTHKRDLFIATHDGIYRINYGHPNFWNGQNMSKILNVEGIRQIAWDPAGYTLYFSVDKELRSFNPDDLAIRTLKTTNVIETFSILPDIGLLVYSEKVMGQLEGLYIVNIREIGGNHVHNFTTDQLFHTAHFFSSSKELMIHFQKSTHLFENIFNPEARSSSKIIENNMAGSDIVRSYKWNGQDLVLTKNQVLYKNMVVVESSTIVDGRLHISYKLLNKICLSAQCSHFCSVHNQTYRCSCPDNMKLHNEFDCVNDLAASCDSDDMFKCESGECIPISKKCNGFADCVDWSDEVGCQKKCPSNQFLCDDGTACIDISFVCNGKKECPDSSDEKYCQYTLKCKSNEFKCHNLKCISTFKVCDGTDDCGDASDEQYCKISKCKFDQLSCDNQTCVGLSQFCDGHFDCLDNSDEANCKKYDLADKGCDFKCDNKCLDGSKLCDGYVDCEDESDEVNCIINYECPHATMLKCRTGHQCYKKEHKCDGFRDCLDGSDEYKCPFVGKCDLDYHFNCNDGTCVEINDYCNGIKDCRNGNDEPVSCATSPLIINFFHNFSRGSSLQLEWNGNRLDSNEFYHISLIDLDTNQAIIDDYRYENRQLTVPHIEICHRYIAAVTLAGTMTGRVIQFTARNEEIKPPKHLNFFYRSNKLSWKYPGKLCIPVTYFVFCYRKNILVFRRFMFENSAILTSEVDSCQIATCPKSVFNISCSKYATIQFEYNRSYKYLVALGVNLPFILFFIFLLVFVWLYFKNTLVSIKNNISKFILFTTNRYRRRFKRRRKFDLALSQLDQV